MGAGFSGDLTGHDNAVMSAVLQGLSTRAALELVPRIHEFSELGNAFFEPARTYSAGMRSRLTFSSSMFIDVDLLLIDELLAVGDANFRKKAKQALKHKVGGDQAIVIVSHSEVMLKELTEKCILLAEGSVVDIGPTPEIIESYKKLERKNATSSK